MSVWCCLTAQETLFMSSVHVLVQLVLSIVSFFAKVALWVATKPTLKSHWPCSITLTHMALQFCAGIHLLLRNKYFTPSQAYIAELALLCLSEVSLQCPHRREDVTLAGQRVSETAERLGLFKVRDIVEISLS